MDTKVDAKSTIIASLIKIQLSDELRLDEGKFVIYLTFKVFLGLI